MNDKKTFEMIDEEGERIIIQPVIELIENLYLLYLKDGFGREQALNHAEESTEYYVSNVNGILERLRSKYEQVNYGPTN